MIYLARHGETTWNASGRYQGRLESALSPLGVRQAFALADYFAARKERGELVPERAISSPLLRCATTALFSSDRLDITLERDQRLTEIDHGTWSGRFRDEIATSDPRTYAAWRERPAAVVFERGESLHDVDERWRNFAETLVATSGHVLIVTHDALVRVALLAIAGRPLSEFWQVRAENGAFAILNVDAGALSIIDECYTGHLRGVRAELKRQAL